MEIKSAKVLDEACNQNNDAYNDEVLYAAWAEPLRFEKEQQRTVASQFGEAVKVNFEAFMARLYACHG